MNSLGLFILIVAFAAQSNGQIYNYTNYASWLAEVTTVATENFVALGTGSPVNYTSDVGEFMSVWLPVNLSLVSGTNTVYQCGNPPLVGIQPVDQASDDDLKVIYYPPYPTAVAGYYAAGRSCNAGPGSSFKVTVVTNVSTDAYYPTLGARDIVFFGLTGLDEIYSVQLHSSINGGYTIAFNWSSAITIPSEVKQDPHFVGLQGEKYSIEGEPDTWFNIVSAPAFQYNGYFQEPCEGKDWLSVFTSLAFKISGHELLVNNTGPPTLDGLPVWTERWGVVPIGPNGIYGSFGRPWENNFWLETPDFSLDFERHMVDFTIQKWGMVFYGTDCVPGYFNLNRFTDKHKKLYIHGLLGQTAHHRHTPAHPGGEGEGEIEGTYVDYEVSDPFGTDFKFNQYTFKKA